MNECQISVRRWEVASSTRRGWGQVHLFFADSDVRIDVSRFTSTEKFKKKKEKKKINSGGVKMMGTGCLLSKVNQLPQPISFSSLRVTEHTVTSSQARNLSCSSWATLIKHTHSHTFHLVIQDVYKNLLASNVLFLFVFNTYFTASAGAVWVYPCMQTQSLNKGRYEKDSKEACGQVSHCFKGWMTHKRQIRAGGLLEGLSIALGRHC